MAGPPTPTVNARLRCSTSAHARWPLRPRSPPSPPRQPIISFLVVSSVACYAAAHLWNGAELDPLGSTRRRRRLPCLWSFFRLVRAEVDREGAPLFLTWAVPGGACAHLLSLKPGLVFSTFQLCLPFVSLDCACDRDFLG
jgi:hypothetical protein